MQQQQINHVFAAPSSFLWHAECEEKHPPHTHTPRQSGDENLTTKVYGMKIVLQYYYTIIIVL